ncbi:MAG: FAD-binding oxidoreductase [Bacteroidia bacterium]
MNQSHFDFIIVGQGIAGTMLAHFLTENGKSVFVIDKHNPSSSSNIAAGIIHPITGRRLVKTWLFDEAYPFARSAYSTLEKFFSEQFFKEIPIIEIYTSIKNKNDWMERSTSPGYENLIGDELPPHFNPSIEAPFGAIKLKSTGFLFIKKLIEHYRKILKEKNQLLEEEFNFSELRLEQQKVFYGNIEADKIIFCEGYYAYRNPFFKSLPYQFAKGELLIVKCEGLTEDYIINKNIYIQPIGNHLFRIGSTFNWDNLNDEPTDDAKEKLADQFSSIIKIPFRIQAHLAAVRPTVKGRRPLIGTHPYQKQIGIFNGLGTKGALLAPYLANHFTAHLVNGTKLMKEVEIEKYDY